MNGGGSTLFNVAFYGRSLRPAVDVDQWPIIINAKQIIVIIVLFKPIIFIEP